MGNTPSSGESKSLSGEKLIDTLNARSSQGNSHSPDTVTFQGMTMYLNEQGEKPYGWRPSHPVERSIRYGEIQSLVGTIGMSDEAGNKLIANAYKSLNGRDNALGQSGIVDPATIRSTHPTSPSSDNSAPKHPKELQEAAVKLAVDPHSYCSLSGMTTQKLLALDSRTLDLVVRADNEFVDKTRNNWNLPDGQRQAVATHVRNNYNEDLCTGQLHLAGTSNRTPIDAFLSGKDPAIKAVNQGFDIYGGNQQALKAFGEVAMSINLATSPSQTLAGRGADTISERTMAFSPDGHSQDGNRKHL
jgi:hypothetical protein